MFCHVLILTQRILQHEIAHNTQDESCPYSLMFQKQILEYQLMLEI